MGHSFTRKNVRLPAQNYIGKKGCFLTICGYALMQGIHTIAPIHFLSATQGASLLGHTFHDPSIIRTEAARLMDWIRSL